MKKNVMTAIVSGAMVGCLAIGGTFAYLTANSGTVKNTFSGSAALGVQIQETTKDGTTYDVKYKNALVGATDTSTPWLNGESDEDGFEYINVVPGAEIKKDVDVKVVKNPTASYLFVKVTGESADYDLNIGTEWKEVDAANHIYVLTENGAWKVVDSSAADQEFDVFDQVTVSKNLTDVDANNIVVTGAVVQATGGITEAEATTEAVNLLK